ncbi:chlorophyllase-1 [Phtheirospermum japonicum]|uniref:Chlorophyllase-1 n=1 Tax=Phtheirospermum japonicum TaxID=374723 RepID=A0A830B0D2_9LAMI|nr:chlorophyllase-1 [Phtheirospermum japonicum]
MAKLEAKIAVSAPSDVFETGEYDVTTITVKTSNASKPPTKLLIVSPVLKGTYPVLLFCHGFMLANTNYTSLLSHIASHGYIVVAPKLLPVSIPAEIKKAAQVTQWLSTGLPLVLPEKVNGDIDKLALSGHSRGGKTAFALALALGKTDQKSRKNKPPTRNNNATIPKFKALIGVDPVAGTSPSSLPAPKILQYIPRSFDISIPVSVIGSGYGNQPLGMIPPTAPDGVNHSEFYNESKPPACYFLAKDYGHCDMLNDKLDRMASIIRGMCKSGAGPRDLMRKSVGGVVIAFLESYLGGDEEDLNAVVGDPSIAPITLDPVIYVKE